MAQALLPYIVEIPFGDERHTKVLSYIMDRVLLARKRRQDRMSQWRDAENLFQSYVTETEVDSRRRTARDNSGFPQYVTITIPYSYATLMTAHSYWTSVFLAREPILQVQGTNGEAQTSEQAIEAMLQYYILVGKNLVQYYIWLLDQGKYGEGIIGMSWDVKRHFIPQLQTMPRTFAGVQIPGTSQKVWTSKEVVQYEGVSLFNVRPHDFLFDPTVTLQNFQRGEFAGHEAFVSMQIIKEGEAIGKFFNVDKVQPIALSKRLYSGGEGNDTKLPQSNIPISQSGVAKGCDLTEITLKMVPNDPDHGLGINRSYVELWTFTIANDTTIVSAQPSGWFHNEFMYDVLEHEIEGYNISKRGMLEMLRPLNLTLDWLINTHFFNVRKTLNNEMIYDPSMLVSKDVEAPGPGKLIRVRPEAYGKDVSKAFHQLQTVDVTQRHMQDAMLIIDMMQRITGVNDTVMGMLKTGRKTATEVRSSSSFAVNRLKTQCEYYSAIGFAPHTVRMIRVAQQMMQGRDQRFFRMVGNQAEMSSQFLKVGPDEIAGEFDYIPVDGTMPIDRSAQAAIFGQVMQQMAGIPQVAGGYDWVRLFGYLAQLQGIRNIERFRVNVVPDATAQQGAQSGSLIPMGAIPATPTPPLNTAQNGAGIDVTASQ